MLRIRFCTFAVASVAMLAGALPVMAQTSCGGIVANGQQIADGMLLYRDARSGRWQVVASGGQIPLYGRGSVALSYVVQETWGDNPRAGMIVIKSGRVVDDAQQARKSQVNLHREAQADTSNGRCGPSVRTDRWSGTVSAEAYDSYHDWSRGNLRDPDVQILDEQFHSAYEGRKGRCDASNSTNTNLGFAASKRSQFSFNEEVVRNGVTAARQLFAIVRVAWAVADPRLYDRRVETRRYKLADDSNVACIRVNLDLSRNDVFLRIVDLEGLDETNRARRTRGPERSWYFAR